jgi:ribonuclease HII
MKGSFDDRRRRSSRPAACHSTAQVCDKFATVTQISLSEIKRRHVLEARPLDAAMEAALRADSRAGARAILQAIGRRRFENRAEGNGCAG